ncbi:twin-arginine translocase TatA/TatE family subunit [Candidatus Bathyarchaeota archaeon]|nr:twin-arginine translocase TatA/TatE family subunit [Candidatus Bathyarchaeota archaeon]
MAIVGWEWIVIVAVIIMFFLWGPTKIPQLARSIGQVRKEFERGSKESSPGEEKTAASGPQDALIDTAKRLGITTEGKTKDEISKEIVQKANTSKAKDSSS